MSQNKEKTEKVAVKQKLALLIQKNSKILLAFIVLIVVIVLALLVYNSFQLKNIEKYTQEIESIQDEYTTLTTTVDETEKVTLEKAILIKLDKLIASSSMNYALQRALFIRANIYYQNQEWDKSIADFNLLAKDFSNSYLAPISLINTAICYEDSNRLDQAIETYHLVIQDYSKVSPEIPNIYFSLGRLYEHQGNIDSALTEYNNLVDSFPDSNWTNLARSRIIYIESK